MTLHVEPTLSTWLRRSNRNLKFYNADSSYGKKVHSYLAQSSLLSYTTALVNPVAACFRKELSFWKDKDFRKFRKEQYRTSVFWSHDSIAKKLVNRMANAEQPREKARQALSQMCKNTYRFL